MHHFPLQNPVQLLAYSRPWDMHLWLDERMLVVKGSKELWGDWAATEGVQGRLRDAPRSSDSCGGGEGWTSWPWGAHHMLPGQWSQTLLPLLGEGGGQARPSVPLPGPAPPPPPRPPPPPPPPSGWSLGSGPFTVHSPAAPPQPRSPATSSCCAPINLWQPGPSSWPGWAVPRRSRSTVEGGGKMWTNF